MTERKAAMTTESKPTLADRARELDSLLLGATPGEWVMLDDACDGRYKVCAPFDYVCGDLTLRDAQAIVAAHNNAPVLWRDLLAENERLRGSLERRGLSLREFARSQWEDCASMGIWPMWDAYWENVIKVSDSRDLADLEEKGKKP